MPIRTAINIAYRGRRPGGWHGLLVSRTSRALLSVGTVGGLVAALSIGSAAVTNVSTTPADHNYGAGWGGPSAFFRHHHHTVIGIVTGTSPTGFTIILPNIKVIPTTTTTVAPTTTTTAATTTTTVAPTTTTTAATTTTTDPPGHFWAGRPHRAIETLDQATTTTTVAPTTTTTVAPTTTTTVAPTNIIITVAVSSSTIYREPGMNPPGLGNVLVGDEVEVTGKWAGSDTLDAHLVQIPLANITGIVTSISTAVAPTTTTTAATTTTVAPTTTTTAPTTTTTAATTTTVAPTTTTTAATTTTTAATTTTTDPSGHHWAGGRQGTYGNNSQTTTTTVAPTTTTTAATTTTTVAPTTTTVVPNPPVISFVLTVTHSDLISFPRGTSLTVDIPGPNVFREAWQDAPSWPGLLVGDNVKVRGTQQGTGVVDALSVNIPLARVSGIVASLITGGFTVTPHNTNASTVTVYVSSSTSYKEPGTSSPNIGDVQDTDTVAVFGAQMGANTINAYSVVINPGNQRQGGTPDGSNGQSSSGQGNHGQGNSGQGNGHSHGHGKR